MLLLELEKKKCNIYYASVWEQHKSIQRIQYKVLLWICFQRDITFTICIDILSNNMHFTSTSIMSIDSHPFLPFSIILSYTKRMSIPFFHLFLSSFSRNANDFINLCFWFIRINCQILYLFTIHHHFLFFLRNILQYSFFHY